MKRIALGIVLAALLCTGDARAVSWPEYLTVTDSLVNVTPDGGTNYYKLLGPWAFFGSGTTVWFYGRGTQGPNVGKEMWFSFGLPIWEVMGGGNCLAGTPTWADIAPYKDGGDLHLRIVSGSSSWSGTYRAFGDGGSAMFRTSSKDYVMVIKSGNASAGSPPCGGLGFGPGNVGDIGLLRMP